jgi:hypothetical protein
LVQERERENIVLSKEIQLTDNMSKDRRVVAGVLQKVIVDETKIAAASTWGACERESKKEC